MWRGHGSSQSRPTHGPRRGSPARRTVCGMLTASEASGAWQHGRAHRFFASARWNPNHVGLVVLGLILG